MGSVGRTSSFFGRNNSVHRKDADKSREREKEEKSGKVKDTKSRGKEKVKERDNEQAKLDSTIVKEGSLKPQRPKLSVATPSSPQQMASEESQLPQSTRKSRSSILRRVGSGSSLKSPEEPMSPTVGGFGKKKKPVFVDRFVRGLDSALELVDGK
jgi:hypothetical protein